MAFDHTKPAITRDGRKATFIFDDGGETFPLKYHIKGVYHEWYTRSGRWLEGVVDTKYDLHNVPEPAIVSDVFVLRNMPGVDPAKNALLEEMLKAFARHNGGGVSSMGAAVMVLADRARKDRHFAADCYIRSLIS